jgi:hypothetical protein
MVSSFKINTALLFPAIKKIAKLVPSLKKVGNIKITVQPLDIVISCPGVEFAFPAETSGYSDIIVPFVTLYAISKTETVSSLTFTFSHGSLKTQTISITSPHILVNSLFTKKEIDLPMNSTALDILRLRKKYTDAELLEYNMLSTVLRAEKKFEDDLFQVIGTLYQYGILRSDILELINQKLKEK